MEATTGPTARPAERPGNPVGREPGLSPDRSSVSPAVRTPASAAGSATISLQLDTDDPATTVALLQDRCGIINPRVTPGTAPFRFRHTATGDRTVTLNTSAATGTVSGTCTLSRWYVVLWLTAGDGFVEVDGARVPLQVGVPVLLPADSVTSFCGRRFRENHIRLSAQLLEHVADEQGTDTGATLRFAPGAAPEAQALSEWNRVLHQISPLLLDTEALLTTATRTSLHRTLATAVLQTFPWNAEQDPPRPKTRVQRALDFIDDAATRPISTADIAAAAGLSARGLQEAFRRDLGTTPQAYLRQIRLAHVRRELQTAPSDATVGDIAHASGFHHLGRFAAAYRERYGEHPKVTLRR